MSEPAEDKPWPVGPEDGPEVQERYGPGENEVVLWDTTSNYARIRQMRLEGKTVPEIAAALELKPSTVKQSLTNQIKAESAAMDPAELNSILMLEMERLDHMVQAHWFAMKGGDAESAKILLAVGRERREWLKWAKPEPTQDLGITNNILVVGGTEAEFLAQLSTAREYLEREHGSVEHVIESEAVEAEDG